MLIEGFRPGVMERLGLGPDVCLAAQPAPGLRPHDRLGPGRAPTPRRAGHDINYLALSGTLGRAAAARDEPPAPPLNLARRLRRRRHAARRRGLVAPSSSAAQTGAGQVVDAAMVDGAALLATMFHGFRGGRRVER